MIQKEINGRGERRRRLHRDRQEGPSGNYDFSVVRALRKRESLTIKDVSERSGIAPAVISKLERNRSNVGLDTLFRLSRVLGMNSGDLLALAEARTAQKKHSTAHGADGFKFTEVAYGNVRCLYGRARQGARLSRPEIHQDDYELCWVLEGELQVELPSEVHVLAPGEAIQFDAVWEHTYEARRATRLLILHLTKGKRF